MVKAPSHSASSKSTFNPHAATRELEVVQARALVAHLVSNPKVDPRHALGALVLRMQGDSDQLDAAERKILRAIDKRVAAELQEQPESWKRFYAELILARPRTRRAQ